MENLFLDIGCVSLNKHSESICGDNYYIVHSSPYKHTVVLSDGLGSGVKANILSTLTSKIISTMLSRNMNIDDCTETVARTLPMCKERKLAYATFSALQIDGNIAYLAQYDNPPAILLRDGKNVPYQSDVKFIGEKEIQETRLALMENDILILMTDGITNAGVGKLMPDGWPREDVIKLVEETYTPEIPVQSIAATIVRGAAALSLDSVDDDTTVVALKLRPRSAVNVMMGPPENREDDNKILRLFFSKSGKHVVCGGSTAGVVSNYLGKTVTPLVDTEDEEVPCMSHIDGVDLVTEGVITLNKTVEVVKEYANDNMLSLELKNKHDGASTLARLLIEDATDISIFFGTAVNPAHDGLDIDYHKKLTLMHELADALTNMGKNVKISMC